MDAKELNIFRLLRRRFFTAGGTRTLVPVTALATSVIVTHPREEPDALYGVLVAPSWLTTAAVTARSTASCTITFGTAAPASATVDCLTVRSD